MGLDEVMKNFNFTPSDDTNKLYAAKEIENKLKGIYGANPKIRCLRTSNPNFGILEQISFCYDKQLRLINCSGKIQCSRNMIIPTYKTILTKYNLQ